MGRMRTFRIRITLLFRVILFVRTVQVAAGGRTHLEVDLPATVDLIEAVHLRTRIVHRIHVAGTRVQDPRARFQINVVVISP